MKYLLIILSFCIGHIKSFGNNTPENLVFLNQTFIIPAPTKSFAIKPDSLATEQVTSFIQYFNKKLPDANISKLAEIKKSQNLNDWLYFKLCREFSYKLSSGNGNLAALYTWYYLSKSGYNCRIVTQSSKVFVFAGTRDSVFDDSYFVLNSTNYIQLPVNREFSALDAYFLCQISYREATALFSFNNTFLPIYNPGPGEVRHLRFTHKGRTINYQVSIDLELMNHYEDHPNTGLYYSFSAPLSPLAKNTLISRFKSDLSKMTRYEGIEYLLSFTREAFTYESDVNHGKERFLSPEQTLFESVSDCEDRAALFYYLVKEIYNMPMIVILYSTHITVAVDFGNKAYGNPIEFKGANYSICEPTGPDNDLGIGESATMIKDAVYTVVMYYKP